MRILQAAILTLALHTATAAAAATPAQLSFAVMRDGEQIGTHVLAFANTGDELRVDIKTDVQVKVLFVTAYRFEHHGTETWRDGRLVGYSSQTNDDGEAKQLQAEATGDGLAIAGSAGQWTADAGIVPASLWDRRIVDQARILNTLDGRPMAIQVQDAGIDQVDVGGRQVPAHHYIIAGDLAREVWYDAEGVLSHVRFAAKDGSQIDYHRQ